VCPLDDKVHASASYRTKMIALRPTSFIKSFPDWIATETAGRPPPMTLPDRIWESHRTLVNPSSDAEMVKNAKRVLLRLLRNSNGLLNITIAAMELASPKSRKQRPKAANVNGDRDSRNRQKVLFSAREELS
jgi:hypothetical protein